MMNLIRQLGWVRWGNTGVYCLAMAILVGCANQYPSHVAYTDTSEEGALVTGIQSYQFNLTTGPRYMQAGAVAPDGEVGEKTGESTRHSTLFGLVEWGNNGVGEAAGHGGIREVRTVQNGGLDILWGIVYSEQKTLVTGKAEYTNHLPIKIPKQEKVLHEGIFLQKKGDLVVKNSQDQILETVLKGEVGKKIFVENREILVSYGQEKNGETTISIQPVPNEENISLSVNDQIANFNPKSSLVVFLDENGMVKSYKTVPDGAVKIAPVSWWESNLALEGEQSKVQRPDESGRY